MSALQAARNVPALGPYTVIKPQPVEASTILYVGALVALDKNGYVVPAQPFGSAPLDVLKVIGVCNGALYGTPGGDVLNVSGAFVPGTTNPAGAAAAILCEIWTGTFLFKINSSDITQAHVGDLCYAVDDQTVSSSDGSNARPVVGKIVGFPGGTYASTMSEGTGVWVDITCQVVPA
jgi:hypothetical protein